MHTCGADHIQRSICRQMPSGRADGQKTHAPKVRHRRVPGRIYVIMTAAKGPKKIRRGQIFARFYRASSLLVGKDVQNVLACLDIHASHRKKGELIPISETSKCPLFGFCRNKMVEECEKKERLRHIWGQKDFPTSKKIYIAQKSILTAFIHNSRAS